MERTLASGVGLYQGVLPTRTAKRTDKLLLVSFSMVRDAWCM
jgi:hypothetical protein